MAYQTLRGFYDILPGETNKWQAMESLIRTVCALYDYHEIRTPIMEQLKVFKRDNDSSDVVNKEMYAFEMNHDHYCLRPEGTAGVTRSVVEHKLYAQDLPLKLYYMGEMFRHERPQKGRQRQFNQFGIENIGVKSPIIDAECIALGYSVVKSFGINSIKVLINTLGDEESRANYREALRAHFKDHLDDLCEDCKRRYEQNPLRILDCKVDHDHVAVQTAPSLKDYLNEESQTYFNEVLATLDLLGIPYEIDDRLVRGLDYYTHTVFEVVSVHDDAGSQSTIFGGGRYDNLMEYFGGPKMSGVGFAIGLERLMMLIEAEGHIECEDESIDVYVMSLGSYQKEALNVATVLRAAGYTTEVNMQERSMKAQFKNADRKKCKFVVIVGEDEVKNNTYALKNQTTKEQVNVSLEEIVETIDKMMEE